MSALWRVTGHKGILIKSQSLKVCCECPCCTADWSRTSLCPLECFKVAVSELVSSHFHVGMHCRSATAVYCWCDWRGSNSHGDLPAELKSAASANSATIAFGVAAGDRTQRKACLRRSRMPIPPRQHMEQVMVIETTSSDWKSDILTVRRYLHISRGDESREVRLPCQAVCVSGVCSRT